MNLITITRKSGKYCMWFTVTQDGCFDLIKSHQHDIPHWRSNQRPKNAEPKLNHWSNGLLVRYRVWDIAVYTADETLLRVSSARYPPLKIEPATKECRAETQPLIQWFTGSISSVGHRGIHCWWDLIKSLISTISPTEDRTSDQRMQSRNSTTDPMVYWFDIECGTSRYTLLMRPY